MRVELLNIGTELLMGFVPNTHATWLGQKLGGIGATLTRQVCINDTPDDILHALCEALFRAELVITTGGLGPTSDDLTRDLVVRLLGLKSHFDERAMENIHSRFRRRGAEMPASVRSQALVPDGATVLYNENGTAPGLAIPLPSLLSGEERPLKCKWLVMLPGPPRELRPMFEKQVLPLLIREYVASLPVLDCRVLHVVGLGESSVEEKVEPLLKGIEGLEIGYCARSGEVDLRLAVRGKNESEVHRKADEAEAAARRALGCTIFGRDGETLEQVVVGLLRKNGCTLSIAESCTGGYIAHRITLVSGSSEVFREGWVVYSNEAKASRLGVSAALIVEHGAVSDPVARSMAENALKQSGADYALAVTGIAGPMGGTTEKPVGTVFIALASKNGVRTERCCFHLDRETFKFITAQTALDMLRLELNGSAKP